MNASHSFFLALIAVVTALVSPLHISSRPVSLDLPKLLAPYIRTIPLSYSQTLSTPDLLLSNHRPSNLTATYDQLKALRQAHRLHPFPSISTLENSCPEPTSTCFSILPLIPPDPQSFQLLYSISSYLSSLNSYLLHPLIRPHNLQQSTILLPDLTALLQYHKTLTATLDTSTFLPKPKINSALDSSLSTLSSLQGQLSTLMAEDPNLHELGDTFVTPITPTEKATGPTIYRSRSGKTRYVSPARVNKLTAEISVVKSRIDSLTLAVYRSILPPPDLFPDLVPFLHDLSLLEARAFYSGAIPTLDAPSLTLEGFKHPLLPSGRPCDLSLPTRGVILTGANGAGKTVALKSIGAACVLTSLGIPLPCVAAAIPAFDNILWDVGDSQEISIGSTFQTRVAAYAEVIKHPGRNLILLDELAAGTERRVEGAVGVGILRHVLEASNSTFVCTSHDTVVKTWGLNTTQVTMAKILKGGGVLYNVVGDADAMSVIEDGGLPPTVVERIRLLLEEGGDGEKFKELNDLLQENLEIAAAARARLVATVDKVSARSRTPVIPPRFPSFSNNRSHRPDGAQVDSDAERHRAH